MIGNNYCTDKALIDKAEGFDAYIRLVFDCHVTHLFEDGTIWVKSNGGDYLTATVINSANSFGYRFVCINFKRSHAHFCITEQWGKW